MIKQSAYLVVLCATALSLSSDVKASDKSSQKLLSAEEHLRCINCPNCNFAIAQLKIALNRERTIKGQWQEVVDEHKNQGTLNSVYGQHALIQLHSCLSAERAMQNIITGYDATIAAHQTSLAKSKHKS